MTVQKLPYKTHFLQSVYCCDFLQQDPTLLNYLLTYLVRLVPPIGQDQLRHRR
ncbi:hypothetical protein Hanom_Chr00s006190g01732951 [Helianthus anomalus]